MLILGAGLAGLVAAYELSKAGYKVQVLEYHERAGGRNWTLRGGDTYTELGGASQKCEFDRGHYINPGPWRIPYHHHAILDYCKRLGVAMEPFIQVNYNAYLHSRTAFGGKPQRFRHVYSDFQGGVTELLAKAVAQDKLDDPVSKEDKQVLLAALRQWGALDANYRYAKNDATSDRRGFERDPGGGLSGEPVPSDPIGLGDIVKSRLWARMHTGNIYEFQSTIFQPVGGMDMIAKAFQREVGQLIKFNAKVTAIKQDARGVTVTYVDAEKGGAPQTATADWCICTIPLSVLSQIDINVGAPMKAAIDAPAYAPSIKIGLQFKRRFWEEDEHDLWRHHLYRSAERADPVSEQRLLQARQGRAARRLCVRLLRVRMDGAVAGRAHQTRRWNSARRSIRSIRRNSRTASRSAGTASRRRSAASRVWSESRAQAALQQSLRARRADHAGRRACVLSAGLAGRRGALVARRDRAAASARGQRLIVPADLRGVAMILSSIAPRDLLDAARLSHRGRRRPRRWRNRRARFRQVPSASPIRTARRSIATVCAGCHMPDGRGAVGAGAYPALARNAKLEAAGYPVLLVVNGHKAMPPFGRQLDDNQVAAVVNYIRGNFGNAYADRVSADDVKAARQ